MPAQTARLTDLPLFRRAIRIDIPSPRPGPLPTAPAVAGHDFLVMNHRPDLTLGGEPQPSRGAGSVSS
jgi:hypothetical protein